jgi:hypothetical protein
MKLARVSDQVFEEARGKFNRFRYEIKAEVSQGICLPGDDFKVKIRIGEFELNTKSPKKSRNGFCFWNKRFDEELYDCPYSSIENMADVIVYLMDGSNPV